MGSIKRSFANNLSTGGIVLKAIVNNASMDNISAFPSGIPASDGITLISSQTASNSASISFTSGLTSTYKAYKFVFIDIHPRTDEVEFEFNMSTDSGSNYNVTKTTTYFAAYHNEGGTSAGLGYEATMDLAQSTSFQKLSFFSGNGADESIAGSLILFNPASTTYVKHFIFNGNEYIANNQCYTNYVAGYGNTTSACNAMQFKMSSGNMDGTILLYGIK